MEANRFTGRYLPDTKVPEIQELDLGNGIKQLIIKYKDAEEVKKQPVLHVFQFLPRTEKIIDMQPIQKKTFPWHDAKVYAITSAPILVAILFADILMKAGIFLPFALVSVAWFWFIFLANTKWRIEE